MFASFALVVTTLPVQDAVGAKRPAAAIVQEFDANPSPGFVLDQDPAEGEKLIRSRLKKQCECAWELFEGWPDHARLPELLFARLMNELNFFHDLAQVRRDVERLLAASKRPDVRALARYAAATATLRDESLPGSEAAKRVEEACAEAGEIEGFGDWRPMLLVELATARTADPAAQRALLERARKEATNADARETIERAQRPLAHVGEPLTLAFDDAFGTGRFDLAKERGHFAIVHVGWFVWGSPGEQFASLRAALPALQKAGVPAVSTVALLQGDEDGRRTALKDAKEAGVSWPLELRSDEAGRATSPLGLDPPSFILVDAEGRVAGVYARLAPALERVLAADGARPAKRRSL